MPSVVICPARNRASAYFIAGVISQYPDLQVSLVSRCQHEASDADLCPDAVLLVTEYPAAADFDHISGARRHYPDACLIVLSLYDSPFFAASVEAAGADVFLPLEQAVERLPALIRRAAPPLSSPYPPAMARPVSTAGT